jgi:hypothetical protein
VGCDRTGGPIEFLMASPGQLDDVLAALDEAAAWLQGRQVAQWSSRFEPSWVEGAIGRGETWLVPSCGDVTVAGAPGQRLDEGPVTVVSRYELRLPVTS